VIQDWPPDLNTHTHWVQCSMAETVYPQTSTWQCWRKLWPSQSSSTNKYSPAGYTHTHTLQTDTHRKHMHKLVVKQAPQFW